MTKPIGWIDGWGGNSVESWGGLECLPRSHPEGA